MQEKTGKHTILLGSSTKRLSLSNEIQEKEKSRLSPEREKINDLKDNLDSERIISCGFSLSMVKEALNQFGYDDQEFLIDNLYSILKSTIPRTEKNLILNFNLALRKRTIVQQCDQQFPESKPTRIIRFCVAPRGLKGQGFNKAPKNASVGSFNIEDLRDRLIAVDFENATPNAQYKSRKIEVENSISIVRNNPFARELILLMDAEGGAIVKMFFGIDTPDPLDVEQIVNRLNKNNEDVNTLEIRVRQTILIFLNNYSKANKNIISTLEKALKKNNRK